MENIFYFIQLSKRQMSRVGGVFCLRKQIPIHNSNFYNRPPNAPGGPYSVQNQIRVEAIENVNITGCRVNKKRFK